MASAIAGGEFCVSASAQIQSRVPTRFRASIIVASLAAVLAVGFFAFRTAKNTSPVESRDAATGSFAAATTSASKFTLPSGPDTYRISQRSTVSPRIIQATIDPPDVHVGNKQTLTVVVQGDTSISFVEAQIETDHGTKTVLLGLVGPVADADLAPERWIVDGSNHLVLNDHQSPSAASLASVANAADAPNLKYQGGWTVEDTHNTKYHTKFIVRDAAGRENSITLAWSDACGVPAGGNWSLSSNGNCTISSVDGVDGGNATIDGGATLTLNSTFAYNPGQSISVTSGAIAIGSGGALQQTYLWVHDTDGDGYPGPTQLAQDTNPGGWQRRYVGNPFDCDDSNASVYQNIVGGTDADQDGYIAAGAVSTACVGASMVVNGRTYYKTSGGLYTWLASGNLAGVSDCNDNNGNRQVLQPAALDCDADGYTQAAASAQCVSVYPQTINSRTYYSTEATGVCGVGGDLYLTAGQILGYPDANDFNPNIH